MLDKTYALSCCYTRSRQMHVKKPNCVWVLFSFPPLPTLWTLRSQRLALDRFLFVVLPWDPVKEWRSSCLQGVELPCISKVDDSTSQFHPLPIPYRLQHTVNEIP